MAIDPFHAVVHRPEHLRYEVTIDGTVAGVVGYEDVGGVRILRHTVIHEAHEGRGLAGELVREAITQATADGAPFATTCPYITHWLTKNPEFETDRVDPPQTGG